jgi:hypothetical protein
MSSLDAPRGADLTLAYVFPASIDVAGFTAELVIYEDRGGDALLTLSEALTANGSFVAFNGQRLEVRIEALDVDALPEAEEPTEPSLLRYDLFVIDVDITTKLTGGLFRVLPFGAGPSCSTDDVSVNLGGDTFEIEISGVRGANGVTIPVSAYWETVLDDSSAAAARVSLGVASAEDLMALQGQTATLTGRVTSAEGEIDELQTDFASLTIGQGSGTTVFSIKADLDAYLLPAANAKAEVYADPTPANNGVYKKIGAANAGSWTKISDLAVTSLAAEINGAVSVPNRDVLTYYQGIRNSAGAAALGVDANGRINARLSTRARRIAVDDTFAPGSEVRGFSQYHNVRIGRRLTYANLAVQHGRVVDVVQRRDGLFSLAMAATSKPVQGILMWGQSNAGEGSGQSPPQVPGELYPAHVVQYYGQPSTYGTGLISTPLFDFVSASDHPAYGQSPCSATCWALADQDLVAGVDSPGYHAYTAWEGGQPLSSFVAGTNNWNNMMAAAAGGAYVAGAYGRTYEVGATIFIQGEGGPAGVATYKAQFDSLIDSFRPAIKSAAGMATDPPFIFVQTNSTDTAVTTAGVELAQLQVGIERLGTGVILAGPMYQCPIFEEVGDDIHASNPGRLLLGDLLALAKNIGSSFVPLYPTTATRAGAVVELTFAVPANGLSWDTTWIGAAANKGFRAFKNSDNSEQTITNVQIVGANKVQITLSADPGSAVKVWYAIIADTADDGWASGRGQLISATNRRSAYYDLFSPPVVPEFVNHYCCRFQMVTSS